MRKHYLDNIRWITVLLVVIYHVIYLFNSACPIPGISLGYFREFQIQDTLQYLLYPWFMVILFVVSGATSRLTLERKTLKEFAVSRTRRLLVPSTIGLLVFQWMQGYVNMTIAGAFETISDGVPLAALFPIMVMSGTGVLWFIQMLWLFSMILLIVRKFEKGKLYEKTARMNLWILVLFAIPLWISAQFGNTPVITVYRFGIYSFAFFMGCFVFAHDEVIDRLSKYWIPLTIAAIVLGCTYTAIDWGNNYAIAPSVNSPLAILYAWFAILAIFGVMKKFFDYTTPFASWMNRKSFGIYVFHYLTMSTVAYWVCCRNGMSAIPSYLLSFIGAIGGSIVLYEVVSRIPVLRWCVLGIRKEKKNVQ